jgi:hypothetical protein
MLLEGRCKHCDIVYRTNFVFKPILVVNDIEGSEPFEVLPGRILVIRCRCRRLVNLVLPKKGKSESDANGKPKH